MITSSSQEQYAVYDRNFDIIKYCSENKCDNWKCFVKKNFLFCNINGYANGDNKYIFKGNLKNFLNKFGNTSQIYLKYWAPSSLPNSYASSANITMPYPNEAIAFSNTNNQGVVIVNDGSFNFDISHPNSYYTQMGSKLNQPEVKIQFCDSNGNDISKIYTISFQ